MKIKYNTTHNPPHVWTMGVALLVGIIFAIIISCCTPDIPNYSGQIQSLENQINDLKRSDELIAGDLDRLADHVGENRDMIQELQDKNQWIEAKIDSFEYPTKEYPTNLSLEIMLPSSDIGLARYFFECDSVIISTRDSLGIISELARIKL